MSASVSPVCGRAGARLSIFTASTGPGAATGSPVNGENSDRGEPVGAGLAGVSVPGMSTATSVAASPMAAAADAPITIFRRGHLIVPTFQEQASVSFRSKDPGCWGRGMTSLTTALIVISLPAGKLLPF